MPLYPFFLDGVAGQTGLQLEDGMHPNAKGVDRMVERILPTVEKAIAAVRAELKRDLRYQTTASVGETCSAACDNKPLAPLEYR